jgi:hypothetical protein
MDNNLTISTLSFNMQYSDLSGSLRREISRGMNLQERMLVKHQTYTDSATKRPGNQSVLIFEFDKALADGTIATVARATLKVQSLIDSNVGSTEVLAVLERVIGTIQEDDSGLDLGDNIFVNKEQ